MISPYEHRSEHRLDMPHECNGFKVDDYVEYNKNNKIRRGYIYCFRQMGFSWFAWIYFDKVTLNIEDCAFVGDLKKIS